MYSFPLPDPGEGLVEAEIVRWLVAAGDTVAVNDIIVEIETSKSLVELPSPVAGTVSELLVAQGTTVDVGTPIITIDDGSASPAPSGTPTYASALDAASSPQGERLPDNGGDVPGPNLVGYGPSAASSRRRRRPAGGHASRHVDVGDAVNAGYAQSEPGRRPDDVAPAGRVDAEPHGDPLPPPGKAPRGTDIVLAGAVTPPRAKPPVRHLARTLGVDLAQVHGTGTDGVITRADVEAAAALQNLAQGRVMADDEPSAHSQFVGDAVDDDQFGASSPLTGGFFADADQSGASGAGASGGSGSASGPFGRARREPIRGVRKVTAQAMIESVNTHVHVTEWVEVDVTETMALVERLRNRREFAGLRVSPLLLHAKAVCLAMAQTPVINASWDEANQEIVYHEFVNLGIAAATPRGLMVPNIKSAQSMSLLELSKAVNHLVQVSRDGKLQPADYANGTFTITNVGVFGIDAGTPIINRDESAILCMGAIQRRPWVVGSGADERIEPRWVTTLALSFDHRLIDGEQGSTFLHDVAEILEDPSLALLY